MTDTAMPVPSPCTSVCQMDAATGWCEGCFRTIDEIAGWASFGSAERLAVWQALPRRRTLGRSGQPEPPQARPAADEASSPDRND